MRPVHGSPRPHGLATQQPEPRTTSPELDLLLVSRRMSPVPPNQYYALRHGISLANEQNIIISHPENGVPGWGLSERGEAECRRLLAPAQVRGAPFTAADAVVYTSDFRRAAQTATIFCELNGLAPPTVDGRLRERHFGDLEKGSAAGYELVWQRDVDDDSHDFQGCESISRLSLRLRDLLDDLDTRWRGKRIVLVSHGDPLQVIQALLLGMRCNEHRTFPPLGNAELRRLEVSPRSTSPA